MNEELEAILGPSLLTIEEAADWCNISTRTIERAIKEGRLKSTSIGRSRRIFPADLLAYVEAGK